ncbi:MAG: Ig-like domain-containing protein [Sandaracinaceae bacterium]
MVPLRSNRRTALRAIALSAWLVACDGGVTPDAGVPDAGAPSDAGAPDAGPPPTELCDPTLDPGPFPAPDAHGAWAGPGGPSRTFDASELYVGCTFLDGGELDVTDHHNLVTMYDGYLLMPWAPEFGEGGLTFWEVDDPCVPRVVGTGHSRTMRETHAIGFSQEGGRWAVVDQLGAALAFDRGGIQFWDISDPSAPSAVADLELEGFLYPDAYARVSLSVFWQAPYVYVGFAQNGVYIVDATDPRTPRLVAQYRPEPVMQVGQVQAIGNLLVVTEAEGARVLLLDISDPVDPQPIAGGDFLFEAEGRAREIYFTNVIGGHLYAANKDGGGGLIVYDIRDPEHPTFAGANISDGNGGYVFVQHHLAFVGESNFATIYDLTDLSNIVEIQRLDLTGDLDTASPIGNVVVLSVDDEAEPDQGSAVVPFATEPDAVAPSPVWVWPADGASSVRTTSRIGIAFDEAIDVLSAHEGSIRLYRSDMAPDEGRVPTVVSAQDAIANVHPRCALEPNTEYTLEVVAGGVTDFNRNAVATPLSVSFTTGVE